MTIENGHEYDPYKLEDSSVGFAKKIMFVNVTGEAKLFNGYIIGMSTLHRPDHCVVREQDDKLFVKADLGAGIIKCHYDGTVKFMNWGPTISLYGEIKYLETHMEFSVDAKTGRDGILHEFKIDDMKGMKVEISGLGPLNWAANYLIGSTASLFKGFIRKMAESQIRNHLSERLPKYQFPVDNTITDIPETEEPEQPETEAPEEPETEAPEEPETEAPEEPETEAPEEPEPEVPEETETDQ